VGEGGRERKRGGNRREGRGEREEARGGERERGRERS